MKNPTTLSRALRAFIVLFIALSVISCQKEINPLDETEVNPGGGGGENGQPNGNSYLPLTTDSYWMWQDSSDESLSWKWTTTGTKKQFGEINYNHIKSVRSDGLEENLYFAQDGDDILMLVNLEDLGRPGSMGMIMLKDKKPVGFTWSTPSTKLDEFTNSFTRGKIIESNMTLTIKGKSYSNVVHTKVDLFYEIFGIEIPAATYNYYLAKGVGLIMLHTVAEFEGTVLVDTRAFITDYSIK